MGFMKSFLIISLLFANMGAASPSLYVLGDDSLLYSESKASDFITTEISPKSWALDAENCRLWVTDEHSHGLKAFEKGQSVLNSPFSGTILSDFSAGNFATLSKEGKVEFRNRQGEILSSFSVSNSESLQKLHLLSNGDSWGLFQKKGEREALWLVRFNRLGQELKRISLSPSDEFWGHVQIFIDELRDQLWVGYSTKSPHHAYAPRIEKFSLLGERQWTHQWDERGFFFDGCLLPNGDFLMARDLPTSPYTVPAFSFIERFEGNPKSAGSPDQVLELETNRLIDSMVCSENSLFFATHSIFGSEPKQLLRWSGVKTENPEVYFTLPFRALKIFECAGVSP